MDLIFFEKQEGQLCAQHALNALLQGSYFVATDLADIARKLDNEERGVYGEGGGYDSPEYLRQFQVDSHNMDDSGFFSVQVISEALKIWNLELVPSLSREDEDAVNAQQDPTNQNAFICNFRQHWFTIRKIGYQWFNLNSMLTKPELISDTYLHLFLTQLQNEGYSIFIIKGALPQCTADEELKLCPAFPTPSSSNRSVQINTPEDDQLAQAVKMSMEQGGSLPQINEVGHGLNQVLAESRENHDADDISLQRALTQSLADREDEDLEIALRMSLGEELSSRSDADTSSGLNDDDMRAIFGSELASRPNVSIQPTLPTSNELSPEELRQRRLAHLERLEKTNSKDVTKM